MTLTPNTTLKAGNHIVSIGRETHFVAILSPSTHNFVELKKAKTNKRLAKVKRELKSWLSCDETFCFERLSEAQTIKLINTLK
tara:strand:- start:390 stop:638 length:249 start_codon:yes stop_codon:yes gene_type:complete